MDGLVILLVIIALAVVMVRWLDSGEGGGAPVQPWGPGIGPPPGQPGQVIPADRLPPVISRTYHGKPDEVRLLQQADAEALAKRGYYPTSQNYVEGRWSGGAWVLAILAVIFLVGILILFYMIASKPAGDLTVIYERRIEVAGSVARGTAGTEGASPLLGSGPPTQPSTPSAMKKCPDCAEEVRAEARICRYCRYAFSEATVPGSDATPTQ